MTVRHTAKTTEGLNLSGFVKAVYISAALKWYADISMLTCRHVNVGEKFQV